ncbi:uncharacterized protein G2W53_039395 [Senna tora]|uniref:Uncharacterized protein n=1 Tax=Senna tora TaxID=362788 RepID=A0A834SNJ3_9FABA|nr:uncharacterized protein G2W53_039395 [Senna tora]
MGPLQRGSVSSHKSTREPCPVQSYHGRRDGRPVQFLYCGGGLFLWVVAHFTSSFFNLPSLLLLTFAAALSPRALNSVNLLCRWCRCLSSFSLAFNLVGDLSISLCHCLALPLGFCPKLLVQKSSDTREEDDINKVGKHDDPADVLGKGDSSACQVSWHVPPSTDSVPADFAFPPISSLPAALAGNRAIPVIRDLEGSSACEEFDDSLLFGVPPLALFVHSSSSYFWLLVMMYDT